MLKKMFRQSIPLNSFNFFFFFFCKHVQKGIFDVKQKKLVAPSNSKVV